MVAATHTDAASDGSGVEEALSRNPHQLMLSIMEAASNSQSKQSIHKHLPLDALLPSHIANATIIGGMPRLATPMLALPRLPAL